MYETNSSHLAIRITLESKCYFMLDRGKENKNVIAICSQSSYKREFSLKTKNISTYCLARKDVNASIREARTNSFNF